MLEWEQNTLKHARLLQVYSWRCHAVQAQSQCPGEALCHRTDQGATVWIRWSIHSPTQSQSSTLGYPCPRSQSSPAGTSHSGSFRQDTVHGPREPSRSGTRSDKARRKTMPAVSLLVWSHFPTAPSAGIVWVHLFIHIPLLESKLRKYFFFLGGKKETSRNCFLNKQ